MSAHHIAIVGAGDIALTLGQKWLKAGHTVTFGVRNLDSEKARSLREKLGNEAAIVFPDQALEKSEVVLLAVSGSAVEEVVTAYAPYLDQKIIIDATNQIPKGKTEATKQWQGKGTLNSFALMQTHAPQAVYFRAFNSYSWEVFADPAFQGTQADLFYCGPEGEPRRIVEKLISDIGLHPVSLGGLESMSVVDDVLQLWGTLALFQDLGRDKVAFKVLTR